MGQTSYGQSGNYIKAADPWVIKANTAGAASHILTGAINDHGAILIHSGKIGIGYDIHGNGPNEANYTDINLPKNMKYT